MITTNGFVAKYSSTGNIEWVQAIEARSDEPVKDIAVSGNGDVFVFGKGKPHFPGSVFSSDSTQSVYYAYLTSWGNILWANGFGTIGDGIIANAIAVNKQNECFLLGTFEDTLIIGTDTLVNSSQRDAVILATVNPDGTTGWVSRTNGSGGIGDCFLAMDSMNNFYTSSFYSHQIQFGLFTFNSLNNTADVIAIKWDSYGQPIWAREMRGSGSGYSGGIALSPDQATCYLSGVFAGYLYLDDTIVHGSAFLFPGRAKNQCRFCTGRCYR